MDESDLDTCQIDVGGTNFTWTVNHSNGPDCVWGEKGRSNSDKFSLVGVKLVIGQRRGREQNDIKCTKEDN